MVSIARVTPTTLRARWRVVNVPVDSWTVKLSLASDTDPTTDAGSGEDEEETDSPIQVALCRYYSVYV